jgi:hypothetical protein
VADIYRPGKEDYLRQELEKTVSIDTSRLLHSTYLGHFYAKEDQTFHFKTSQLLS